MSRYVDIVPHIHNLLQSLIMAFSLISNVKANKPQLL